MTEKKQKKERTDEEKVKRAKIILIVMAAVIAILVFVPTKHKKGHEDRTPYEIRMDNTLDSVIRDMGYTKYDIYYKGEIECLAVPTDCPLEDELATVEMRIKMITSLTTISEKEKMKRLDEALKDKERLTKGIAEFKRITADETYYSRRIRFSLKDGSKYTFFQQLFPYNNRVTTKYFMDITHRSEKPKSEIQ